MQHGNGKRWLLIGLLALGAFWLVNDSYDDGFRDALVQTGQTQEFRHYQGGPHFPWGLLILGGIGFVAWRKGAFDRFGGPGGPFGSFGIGGHHGERGVQRYGESNGSAQTPGAQAYGQGGSPVFRGPRAYFDEWHRQAHEENARAQYPAPPASPAASAGTPVPVMRPHRAASRRLRRQPHPRPNTGRRWLAQLRRPGPPAQP